VIKTLECLAKTSRAELVNDLPPVRQMVIKHNCVVPSVIIEPIIVALKRGRLDLLCPNAEEIDLWVVLNLYFLIVCHPFGLEQIESLLGRHGELAALRIHLINDFDLGGWLLRIGLVLSRVILLCGGCCGGGGVPCSWVSLGGKITQRICIGTQIDLLALRLYLVQVMRLLHLQGVVCGRCICVWLLLDVGLELLLKSA
jgi:hypothetical protein